ncbi:MAG: hypothetical protein AAB113_08085 [Candidatus Eisenbacteria bacterium]
MSVAPPPTPSTLREMRASAIRQTRTLRTGLAGLLAVGFALALVAAFTTLDYSFGQGSKILAKILLGVLGVSAFLVWQLWAFLELFRSATTLALCFITMAMVRGERDRQLLSWSVVAGLACESVTTPMPGRSGSGDRALGSFGQSNELGAFLAGFTVFAAALLPAMRGWLARGGLLLVLGPGSLAIFLTVSRAAIIAGGLGMLVAAWRSSRAMLFVVVAALVTSPFWPPADVQERPCSP